MKVFVVSLMCTFAFSDADIKRLSFEHRFGSQERRTTLSLPVRKWLKRGIVLVGVGVFVHLVLIVVFAIALFMHSRF